jgi:hypothetical protein
MFAMAIRFSELGVTTDISEDEGCVLPSLFCFMVEEDPVSIAGFSIIWSIVALDCPSVEAISSVDPALPPSENRILLGFDIVGSLAKYQQSISSIDNKTTTLPSKVLQHELLKTIRST